MANLAHSGEDERKRGNRTDCPRPKVDVGYCILNADDAGVVSEALEGQIEMMTENVSVLGGVISERVVGEEGSNYTVTDTTPNIPAGAIRVSRLPTEVPTG